MTAHAYTATTTSATGAPSHLSAAHAAAVQTVRGPAVTMMYGPVQVTIKVSGTHVTSVTATAPTDHPRSQFINQQAVPILDHEALSALSAHASSIHLVGGATLTSRAFVTSLASALRSAHVSA